MLSAVSGVPQSGISGEEAASELGNQRMLGLVRSLGEQNEAAQMYGAVLRGAETPAFSEGLPASSPVIDGEFLGGAQVPVFTDSAVPASAVFGTQ